MSILDLRPCPFCGGRKISIEKGDGLAYGRYYVSCESTGCGAMLGASCNGDMGYYDCGYFGEYETEADAADAWNNRRG